MDSRVKYRNNRNQRVGEIRGRGTEGQGGSGGQVP